MYKNLLLCLFVVMLSLCLVGLVLANPPTPEEKYKHADKNKDGVVDKKEMHMEKQWEQKQRSKVNTRWEKKADTNGDGIVDANEASAWEKLEKEQLDLNNDGIIDAKEKRLYWQHSRAKVNTAIEKKYDANGDGWLEPAEAKEMLKDKQVLIKTHGKAKVDTALEAEYDTNGDGVIDAKEAEAMKQDTQ
jgi:Ca2+-binding EF-hand superfamily protein